MAEVQSERSRTLGQNLIIAIVISFIEKEIPTQIDDAEITFISPDCELKDLGVDFYKIEDNGLEKVFKQGYEKGLKYLRR